MASATGAVTIMPSTAAAAEGDAGSWPSFAPDEIAAAVRTLESGRVNYWTGEEGRRFEEEFAAYCGTRHAVALANGTVALELAFAVLDLAPGDEVVVTPRSYYASAASAALRGLVPVFADVDRDSQNLTAATVERALTPRTRAVVPVHLAGWPCDMPAISDLARSRGLHVVEDCAQAHGAAVGGRRVGSFGRLNAFSFCQDKIMTTGGEGGMVTTDDRDLWRRAWELKDHGKSHTAVYDRSHPPGFRWLHESLGTNWRLTEMQSAIGRAQLRKLDGWLERRARNAAILTERLGGSPALRVPVPGPGVRHAWYKWYGFVRSEALAAGWDRDRIMVEASARGVACFAGTCPEIYREVAMRRAGFGPAERLPVARELGETSLMLLVHPTLDDAAMHRAADVMAEILCAATR
jgi:hypothetical protein